MQREYSSQRQSFSQSPIDSGQTIIRQWMKNQYRRASASISAPLLSVAIQYQALMWYWRAVAWVGMLVLNSVTIAVGRRRCNCPKHFRIKRRTYYTTHRKDVLLCMFSFPRELSCRAEKTSSSKRFEKLQFLTMLRHNRKCMLPFGEVAAAGPSGCAN